MNLPPDRRSENQRLWTERSEEDREIINQKEARGSEEERERERSEEKENRNRREDQIKEEEKEESSNRERKKLKNYLER